MGARVALLEGRLRPEHLSAASTALEALRNASSALQQFQTAGPQPSRGSSAPVPVFEVSLDDYPHWRWNGVVDHFQGDFEPLVEFFKKIVPDQLQGLVYEFFDVLHEFFPPTYRWEIEGIATRANLTVGMVTVMNVFYEVSSGCTSIVANAGNRIVHGRNLDYGVPGLRRLEATIRFTRGGELQYVGTTYAGYVGILTGVAPGRFSVSIDERFAGGNLVTNFLEAVLDQGQSIGFFLRDVLEQQPSYQSALHAMQTAHMASVSYMILGGVNKDEGAVVTRERHKALDTWTLDSTAGRWFLVETNYDHWKPAPAHDDRRDPAIRAMSNTTAEALDEQYLFKNVMLLHPVLNSGTTYTAIMSAATGTYWAVAQNV